MLGRMLVATALLSLVGLASGDRAAHADFTCSSNDDCFDTANQCDPGRTPCNDGICDPDNPEADAIGCVLEPNNGKCDDGLFCNGTEFCDPNHGCQLPPPPNCNDNVPCTQDRCDEELNRCVSTRRDTLCNDGLFCNGPEVCTPSGCQGGTPPNCNDGVPCTQDVCDELQLSCVNTPNNQLCSNGQFCDGVERCDPDDGCRPGNPPNCNDSIPCTTDSCNEANDTCTNSPNNQLCNNGQFCDGVEQCVPGQGCRPGTAPNCGDSIPCTVDTCDEANDRCNRTPNNQLCSDGTFCNGVETCSPTLGCRPGVGVACGDNIPCTVDTCIEATDSCQNTPNNQLCSDGKHCDGVEICSPTLGCQEGTPPNCSDNVVCTVDACVEATDSCSHTVNNQLCSNGQFCDGVEVCSPTQGCQPGTAPNCGDSVVCTVDVCDEVDDRCRNTPDHSLCANALFCDGVETCSPLTGCREGNPIFCNDNVECTQDYCDEVIHDCNVIARHERCGDGIFCNGDESCDEILDCVPGQPPVCADNLTCTTDICSEDQDMCIHIGDNTSCGNGVVEEACGEECDPGNNEICDNFIDDDGDGLTDCADEDCEQGVATCDADCILRNSCVVISRDPAVISFPVTEARTFDAASDQPGKFTFHGRMAPKSELNPLVDGFSVTLTNLEGEIYRADVKPADIESRGLKRFFYKAPDRDRIRREGGIARFSAVLRTDGGEISYGIRVQAYGDFSRATLPQMTTQAYFGDDVGFVTATWSGEVGRWKLAPKDYDDGTE